ncbi:hypothetical protein LCGC14_1242890 [marine sediment metagenome]|uniref:Resolvase/invertase-type recombinase catalytic domain-containing protein n=1 Tax=marine sediment metagenome TaxID=412755 RepID=A0A0F9L5C4_9ZZZZ
MVWEAWDVATGARRRERLDEVMDLARRRQIDMLAVWALDRLTREGILKTMEYIHRLSSAGVKVYCHEQAFLDPRQPTYNLVLAIFAWVAAQERKVISERTKAGLERTRRDGKVLGRPPGSRDKRKRRRRGYLLRWDK